MPQVSLRGLIVIAQGWQLRIRYCTASRRVISWRTISLLALRPLYLDTFCRRRCETLTFFLARILDVEGAPIGSPAPSEPPPPPAAASAVGLAADYDELS